MRLSDTATISRLAMTRQVDDEVVILDLASGTYFGLDAMGTRIWGMIGEGNSLGQICESIVAQHDVHEADVQRDVLELAQSLLDRRLIEIA